MLTVGNTGISLVDWRWKSGLHFAAKGGHVDVMRPLLGHGAFPGSKNATLPNMVTSGQPSFEVMEEKATEYM